MIPARPDAVAVGFDNQGAGLRVRGMDVFDDHDIANSLSQGLGLPAIGSNPAIPGRFLFERRSRAILHGTAPSRPKRLKITRNNSRAFHSTKTTIVWSGEQAGFQFQSDTPPDPAANLISVRAARRMEFSSVELKCSYKSVPGV